MIRKRALAGRLARLETAAGRGAGEWLLTVPAGVLRDPDALALAVEDHRQRTGHRGALVATVPQSPNMEAWALSYAPPAGRA